MMTKHALTKVPPALAEIEPSIPPQASHHSALLLDDRRPYHSADRCLCNAPTADPLAHDPPLRGISLFSPRNATGLNLVTQEEPQSKRIAKIPSRRIGEVIGPWI
jgi:hypothetical protein